MKSQEIAYIILSFVLAATFISIFFFTYVSSVEADIIKTQINNVVSNFISEASIALTPDQKAAIGKIVTDNLSVPDMSSDDADAENTNKKLIKKSIIIFSTLVAVGILAIIILWYFYRFDLVEITKYSLIILALVATTEILFVTLVTKNYRLIDENYVSYLLVNNLQNYANS